MGGWGCPHEYQGRCGRVLGHACEPGMKGCVLAGRFLFSDPDKNTRRILEGKARQWRERARTEDDAGKG